MPPGDIVLIVVALVVGPWGLVLAVALMRGYDLRVLITRGRVERRSPDGDDEAG